ncbi:MAG: DUF2779 domain-containing protein [Sedimentisphaerales bacterium]
MAKTKTPVINKDIFLNTLTCPVLGWTLSRTDKSSTSPPTLADQLKFEEGLEIHERARTLFPTGTLIPFSNNKTAAETTQKLLTDKKIEVLFEATFCSSNFVTKADILKRNKGGWHLYEVKSATNDSQELIDDMAYTVMVAQKAKLEINSCSLLLVSKDYRLGMANKKLFTEIDYTEEVFEKVDEFLTCCDDVEKIILGSRKPKANLIFNCRGCDLFDECTGKDAEHHIFELPHFSEKQLNAFIEKGVVEISEIPNNFGLPSNQEIVRKAVSENRYIVKDSLKNSLKEIEFPAYYLDFETVNTCLPLYPDTAPYAQVPTQYSIHKCSKIGQVVNHYEYLADPSKDCRRELAEKLIKDCGKKGSVVTYSPFEKMIVNGLIKQFSDLSKPLEKIIDRMVDLCALIRNNYYHPDFCGSYSIKITLPVLVPDMSYEHLEIGNGGLAMTVFAYMVKGRYNQEEISKIRKNLLEYCKQDTMAMVRLNERLGEMVNEGRLQS